LSIDGKLVNSDLWNFLQNSAKLSSIMPINPANYGSRGGNLAIVLLCPNIVAGDHLVYFDYNKTEHWVIRDLIAGQRLDNYHSQVTVAQIIADATHDEAPPWLNVEENPAEWRLYLELRTTALRKLNRSLAATERPNPASGDWQPIRP
jgi:hypothetical protein